jgi:hypothetical protein
MEESMSVWQRLMSGALGEFTKRPSWLWRAILLLALLAFAAGFSTYYVFVL